MKIVITIYIVLTIVFFIDLVLSITVLEFVRQAINVRERPKISIKIEDLKAMKKYTFVWP